MKPRDDLPSRTCSDRIAAAHQVNEITSFEMCSVAYLSHDEMTYITVPL